MIKKSRTTSPREMSLSRERIVEAAIALLDSNGIGGLTFRALSERLATGAGAIYWYIAHKDDLLMAASDTIVARTVEACALTATPEAAIRTLALGMFDTMDAHPWVGSALTGAPGQLPVLRLVERIGQQLHALGVPQEEQWAAVSALLSYILGVAGQNATNAQFARTQNLDRTEFLTTVSAMWAQLDAKDYPFVRSVAAQFRAHDDRADFLAGVDLILSGLASRRPRKAKAPA